MRKLPLSLFLLLSAATVQSQTVADPSSSTNPAFSGIYGWWSARSNDTQSKQPAWAVPLVTTYTGLFQVVRTDILRQTAPALTNTWIFDNGKGVSFMPGGEVELDLNLPSYIEHNTTAVDGWGDFSFLGKYRLASGNAQHGTYTLSTWVLTTFPTGTYKNGSSKPSLQPNLGGGKGFGRFDVQSSIGATLPTGNPAINASGRPVLWNAVAQYRFGKLFWPEVESNATFFKGGTNDGKTQEFVTPGLIVGRCALHPSDSKSRPGLAVGAGMQIAASHFHTYNHGLVFTARWIF